MTVTAPPYGSNPGPSREKPDIAADLAPQISGILRYAWIVIAVFLAIFIAWSALAPLSKAAIAPGYLEVEGKRRVIQHLEGGIVQEILVTENQRVSAGQPLVILDRTQSSAVEEAAQSELAALTAEEARLNAERENLEEITFPQALLDNSDDPEIAEILSNQQDIFDRRRQSLLSQREVLEETAAQARSQIVGLNSQIKANQEQLRLHRDELKRVKQLAAMQLQRRSLLTDVELRIAGVIGTIGSLKSDIARANQSIAETEARIRALEDNRADEIVSSLRDVKMRTAELRERVRSAVDVNTRRTIVAPVDGEIVNLRFRTIGGVIRPGDPVMDIVPDQEKLIITARVQPTDIENVHAGLDTEIRLLPYSGRNVPTLQGIVTAVSADVMYDRQSDAEPYYQVTVEIDDDVMLSREDIRLVSGMPAEVYIILGSRTLIQYFFQPIVNSFNRSFRET